jgi:hypothetical protein
MMRLGSDEQIFGAKKQVADRRPSDQEADLTAIRRVRSVLSPPELDEHRTARSLQPMARGNSNCRRAVIDGTKTRETQDD